MKIIFVILLAFVYNFYDIYFPAYIYFFAKKSKNEYIVVENRITDFYAFTFKVNIDNIILIEEKSFDKRIRGFGH